MRRTGPISKINKHGLTPKEMEYLRLVCEGLSDEQIATKCDIKTSSVAHRIKVIEYTLNPCISTVWTRDQLIAYAKRIFAEEQ